MMASLLVAGLALALVLVGVGLVFRAVNRIAFGGRYGAGRSALSVVARVGVGPRQGLAVVRVGDRGVVVSMGEGGVHPVLELSAGELAAFEAGGEAAPSRLIARVGMGSAGRDSGSAAVGAAAATTDSAAGYSAAVTPLAVATSPARDSVASRLARRWRRFGVFAMAIVLPLVALLALAGPAAAQTAGTTPGVAAIDSVASRLLPQIGVTVGARDDGFRLSGTVGMVVVLGLLTTLPTLLLLMTSFTRILVVLHFLRQALGTQTAPPAHLMAALALLLTGFVMAPTLREVNDTALRPWTEGRITEGEMLAAAAVPFREFMLRQTREEDLALFLELSEVGPVDGPDQIPLTTLMSAFAIGELRTAFQIGFAVFLPFVVIDIVVAAVLTSMGMFMLPPAMIALPLKLMLFVLVDGWSLVVQSLFESFR